MNKEKTTMQLQAGFFNSLVNQVRDLIAVIDERMIICFVNETVLEQLGWQPEEMIGKPAGHFIHPDDLSELAHRFQRLAGTQPRKPIVLRLLTAQNSYQYWEFLGSDARTNPEVNGFVITARSVNDRNDFQLELRQAQQRQQALLQAFPDWVGRLSKANIILDARAPFGLEADIDIESFIGQHVIDVFSPDQAEQLQAILDEVQATKTLVTREIPVNFPDLETIRLLEIRACPSGHDEILIIAKEITELRATELQLGRQKELLRSLHEMSVDLLERLDLNDVMHTIVLRAKQLLGTDHGVIFLVENEAEARLIAGQGIFDVKRELTIHRGRGAIGDSWAERRIIVINNYPDYPNRVHPDNGIIPQAFVATPLISDGRVKAVLGLGRMEKNNPFVTFELDLLQRFSELAAIALDNALLHGAAASEIRERQSAERELRQRDVLLNAIRYAAEAFLSGAHWQECLPPILERLGEAAGVDSAFVYRHTTDPQVGSCYLEQAVWLRPDLAVEADIPDADFTIWQQQLENNEVVAIISEELPSPMKEFMLSHSMYGSILAPIFVNQTWWGVVGLSMLTKTRRWEEAVSDALQAAAHTLGIAIRRQRSDALMLRTQKLESLGLLAGGIAHDFNNLLTGILGQTSVVAARLPDEHPVQRNVEKAMRSTHNASELVKQMLAYAGKEEFVVQPLNLNELILSNAGLLDTVMPSGSRIVFDLAKNLPAIMGDKGQIQQVVMNLAINAAQALPNGEGQVSIATGAHVWTPGEQVAPFHFVEGLPAGNYVTLTVKDTGIGMDPATLEKVFDPFFSTKPEGHGLGLSATQGIVQNHGGYIWIDSQPDQGTEFWIMLPATDELSDQAIITPLPTPVANGVVLVIDDEHHVREAAADMLGLAGVEVISAEDGPTGIRYYEQHHDQVALVILDMVMPRMNGEQTFAQLKLINRDVKVILSTGYGDLDAKERFVNHGILGFLQKPYDAQQLLEMVQMALATTTPPSTIGPARS